MEDFILRPHFISVEPVSLLPRQLNSPEFVLILVEYIGWGEGQRKRERRVKVNEPP